MNEIIQSEEKHELSPFTDADSFKKIFDIGKMFASSQLVPQTYQGKPMDCTIAVDMANRMGVSPMMVMQNLYVVKGKPTWSGQACMSMIRGSKEFKNVRPVYTGERNTDSWGCYIQAEYRETGEIVRGTEVTISMAKQEGWYSKKDRNGNELSKWQSIPEQMLAYRAAAFFARVYIPNSLMGVYVEGEPEDIEPKPVVEAQDPFEAEVGEEQ
ncbi:recombinase RecT [Anaerostipes sp. AF04-45]|uniref:recombinase RecT n=1 Tax=Anaerostipes sp. AF04-45 TaxID=2292912 RepID=UPI000E5096A8|nr:recombinase RecT [Anaerostipes sp. AF04-45]RGH21215.1 hypothetical protein DWV34_15605 [Anaerostipes sp. AF04-45]